MISFRNTLKLTHWKIVAAPATSLSNVVMRIMSRAMSKTCDISLLVVVATNPHFFENGMELL